MGRPRNPVDHSKPARGELAVFLRELQNDAGIDNTALAELTGLHPDRVRRTLNGQTLPTSITVVEKIVTACCADRSAAFTGRLRRRGTTLWHRARLEAQGLRPVSKPEPELIGTYAALVDGMERLRMHAGNPSTRTLEEKAGPGLLPHTSLDRVFARDRLPTKLQVTSLAKAVGLPEEEVEAWGVAWARAEAEVQREAARREEEVHRRARQARGFDAVGALLAGQVRDADPVSALLAYQAESDARKAALWRRLTRTGQPASSVTTWAGLLAG
ncbi:hypothetical protein Kpho02_60510 [Kitasatospora phosalacinea]|uniref:Uncharacterized protein n=1 Tax=Kitasatospora phosalacinea TaxID=2065 RepID=A0A9W6QEZ5_9ACTN|nr:helix-turn-helix transcriptional regulator [Kitasatospora phosalacinea]GLW73753.1 hypothetical protein Kpho02_60510 [Kitasatospora phosalacinea]